MSYVVRSPPDNDYEKKPSSRILKESFGIDNTRCRIQAVGGSVLFHQRRVKFRIASRASAHRGGVSARNLIIKRPHSSSSPRLAIIQIDTVNSLRTDFLNILGARNKLSNY